MYPATSCKCLLILNRYLVANTTIYIKFTASLSRGVLRGFCDTRRSEATLDLLIRNVWRTIDKLYVENRRGTCTLKSDSSISERKYPHMTVGASSQVPYYGKVMTLLSEIVPWIQCPLIWCPLKTWFTVWCLFRNYYWYNVCTLLHDFDLFHANSHVNYQSSIQHIHPYLSWNIN